MDTKKVLTVIVGAVVLIVGGSFAIRSLRESTKIAPKVTPTISQPTPTPISKPAPVKTIAVAGTIVEIKNNELTIKYQDTLQIYSIAQTKDFKKVISGSSVKGDAISGPSSASELKIGQEVSIIIDVGSTNARSIYIIK